MQELPVRTSIFKGKNLLKVLVPAIVLGVLYGLFLQLLVRKLLPGNMVDFTTLMTVGYVFLVPLVIGYLTVHVAGARNTSTVFKIFMPWVPAGLCLFISLVVGWEGSICLIMATPVTMVMSTLGGVLAGLVDKFISRKNNMVFAAVLFAPLVSGYGEKFLPAPHDKEIAANEIIIQAKPETVWQNIIRVKKITEKQESSFFTMGFPKPVEATLSKEGVGGIRDATFERGLTFIETVTVWQPLKKLSFTIKSHPENTPLTTLDPHVTVGGDYFDVLNGTYEIEKISETQVKLLLKSEHRISTRFNFYSKFWSRYLMSEIQQNILHVLKERCEKI